MERLIAERLEEQKSVAVITVSLPASMMPEEPNDDLEENCLERLTAFSLELLKIIHHPVAPGKLTRERHFHCGRDKANHEGLCKELFGIWPAAAVLKKENCRDIALILPDGPTKSLEYFMKTVEGFEGKEDLRFHVLLLGETIPSDFNQLEEHIVSKCALNIDVEKWTPHQKVNYFGVPLYERVGVWHQERVTGRLMNMDVVINFAGPIISGPMLTLKKFGAVTVLAFHPQEEPDALGRFYERPDLETIFTDPMSALAYTGAYKAILAPDDNAAMRLRSLGVPKAMIKTGGGIRDILDMLDEQEETGQLLC